MLVFSSPLYTVDVNYADILILFWSIPQQADIIQYQPKSQPVPFTEQT